MTKKQKIATKKTCHTQAEEPGFQSNSTLWATEQNLTALAVQTHD